MAWYWGLLIGIGATLVTTCFIVILWAIIKTVKRLHKELDNLDE